MWRCRSGSSSLNERARAYLENTLARKRDGVRRHGYGNVAAVGDVGEAEHLLTRVARRPREIGYGRGRPYIGRVEEACRRNGDVERGPQRADAGRHGKNAPAEGFQERGGG